MSLSVDFNTWNAQSLPDTPWAGLFGGHVDAVWNVDAPNAVYLGTENNAPSMFCSPFGAVGYHMEGNMTVSRSSNQTPDDDYIGFAIGYKPDDFTSANAEYYLIDWKRNPQFLTSAHNPCGRSDMNVGKGLAISKVTGYAAESEYWAHRDYDCNPGGVTELARATNLGSTGWQMEQEYEFCLEVTENSIKLSINDEEEISYALPPPETLPSDASVCFYSFSQYDARWDQVTIEPLGEHGCDGDPHFRTWTEEHFEYHGQCDLVLTKDPDFAEGLGLDVHIRTKLVRYWSYIKTAVIRIGNDVLEIEGSAVEHDSETHYWVNYEYQGELTEFAGFPVKMFSQEGTKVTKNRIEIDLSSKYPGQKIVLSTFKEFVKVKFVNSSEKSYGNTVGMLGDFKTGKTLARDGVTEIHDFTEYGHEWQVLPTDGKLFRSTSKPQFPELCIEPEDPRGDRKRRLAESTVSMEDAEAACAGLKDALDRKDCVYDIIATQDMDMVGAY